MKKYARYLEINKELKVLSELQSSIWAKFELEFKALKSQIWKESVQSNTPPNWQKANDFKKDFYKNTPELDILDKKTKVLLDECDTIKDEVYAWKLKNGWKLEKPCQHCNQIIMIYWNKKLNIWTLQDTETPYSPKVHFCPFKKYLKRDKI